MKVLMLTTFYHPVVGGVETQVHDIAGGLMVAGHEVQILTSDAGRGGSRLPQNLLGENKIEGISVVRVSMATSISQFHKLVPAFWPELMKLDYDLVHVHGIRKSEVYMALVAAKLRGKRIVVSTHNPFTTVGRSFFMKLLILLHDLTFGVLLMRFVDKYFLLSATEKTVLRRFGIADSKLVVVGNSLSGEFYQDPELSRKQILEGLPTEFSAKNWEHVALSVGRLNPVKGFEHLLHSAKNNPQVLFIILGGDDGSLVELQKIFSGMTNVYLPGEFLPRRELISYYAAADVFILPSLHEPFGIVLLEAMAQGCAIIATDCGGPAEILQKNAGHKSGGAKYGLLVPTEDGVAISKALGELISDPLKLDKYKTLAKERSKDYRFNEAINIYLSSYVK